MQRLPDTVVHCKQSCSFIASKVNALDIELQIFTQLLVHDISGDIYQLSERFYSQYMLIGKLYFLNKYHLYIQ